MSYSVLMSVYNKENPDYLWQSMKSVAEQTVPTDDFVLVCDGPLNSALDCVIDEMQKLFGNVLHVVRLPQNRGLGNALNYGMDFCKNEIIARMDSDDIAYPQRCEKELDVLLKKELDIISAGVAEFTESIDVIDAKRIPPETHEEIIRFAKKRNPFNHPCVMYRKSAVEAAGGYQDFYLLEDYCLWLRMLLNGSRGYNIQEPLLWMRAGSDMYKRRAGWKYATSQRKLFKFMYQQNFISLSSYLSSCIIRSASAMAPNGLRKFMFGKMLRKM